MKWILLILASSGCLFAQQAISFQTNRPYNQAQPYRQWQYPYGRFQTYGQPQTFIQPYYDPYYIPYQPDNGPMRGPNSIEGHQYRPYRY